MNASERHVTTWPLLSPDAGVTVVIPTKDEEGIIAEIVDAVRPHADEILVIDGHSSDRTREIAADRGARVILDAGRGKGEALRRSFEESSHEILVFIDADGSHDPRDIPRLVEPIRRGQAELVIASRTRGGSDELHGTAEQLLRYVGSQLIMLAINYRWRREIDRQSERVPGPAPGRGAGAAVEVEPDDDRAGDVDARAEGRLPGCRGSEPRVRASLGRFESPRVAIVVGVFVVGDPEHRLTGARRFP